MTTNNNDDHKFVFEIKTYNGISIIRETTSGYINASQMCSDNNRKWRSFTTTKNWKNKLAAFKRSSIYRNSEAAQIWAPSFIARKQVRPEYQGEYIHPKLIHFVAEWCSDDYAFQVAELMDSINENVHRQMKEKKLEDTPENSETLFAKTIEEIIRQNIDRAYNEQMDIVANEKLEEAFH